MRPQRERFLIAIVDSTPSCAKNSAVELLCIKEDDIKGIFSNHPRALAEVYACLSQVSDSFGLASAFADERFLCGAEWVGSWVCGCRGHAGQKASRGEGDRRSWSFVFLSYPFVFLFFFRKHSTMHDMLHVAKFVFDQEARCNLRPHPDGAQSAEATRVHRMRVESQ